jgi:hypothetical protein
MHVDGNEELLLIKGTWKSLAFFTAGAFANQLLQTDALAVGGVDVGVARAHLRRSRPSYTDQDRCHRLPGSFHRSSSV